VTSFTQVFGGGTLDPAQPSFKSYTGTSNITAVWPIESAASNDVVAAINNVAFTASGLTFSMPPANQVSVGYNSVFNNLGAFDFTLLDSVGNTLLTVATGTIWSAYISDNATASGAYNTFQAGAGTSSATAGGLAGLGIKAITTTLNQEYPAFSFGSVDTPVTIDQTHRAGAILWNGGAGVFNFAALGTLTTGWFANIINQGTGALTLTPSSVNIDGATTKILNPGDSCIVTTDGSAMYTVGFGQDAVYAFSYLTIPVGGSASTYTLSGAELNVTALKFTGARTAAIDIIVPSTVQQYWMDNSTTGLGPYVFGVRTTTQTTPGVVITNDGTSTLRSILYCNGADVVNADTLGLSTPLGISDGGTGATTATQALANLGGQSQLDVFSYAQMFG
jgi:hypothetical protein